MINAVDDFLLDVFQRTSDWLQAWTGKTCFWYAMACLYADCAIMVINDYVVGAHWWEKLITVFFLLFNLSIFGLVTALARKNTRDGFVNPEVRRRPLRVLMLFLLAVSVCFIFTSIRPLANELFFLDRTLMVSWSYFVACTPKPPAKSKVREAVEKLSLLLTPVPNPT